MNLAKVISQFPTEETCRQHFKEQREKLGITCKKCGCRKHYWLQKNWQWQCKECNFRTTLKSGTMFQHSNLPLRIWYLAIAFMCFSKKAVSACEMQRQLNHSRYDTIWSLMHRIRNIMGNRDALQQLEHLFATDDKFFIIAAPEGIKLKRIKDNPFPANTINKSNNLKSSNQASTDQAKNNQVTQIRVLASVINEHDFQNIGNRTIHFTNKAKTYSEISKYVETYIISASHDGIFRTAAQGAHLAIENVSRVLAGIYHQLKLKYLQLYLDEFCYKFNRRHRRPEIFDRMIVAVLQNPALV
jgi:hypothetical protein